MRLHSIYKKGQCVPACKMCNYMKLDLDYNVFISICYHIAVFNKKMNGALIYNAFRDYNNVMSYSDFVSRAKNKFNAEFCLSKDEYNKFIMQDCYICGKKAHENHKNSIDRFDNSIDYIKTNIRPCCTTCNYMKKNLDYNIFIDKCHKIAVNFENVINEFEVDIIEDNLSVQVQNNNVNKMTKEDKEKRRIELKKTREQQFIENNTDEKLKERAKEIAEKKTR